jgi:acetylornithine deacetylase/succinyl-diaminopimelate desuccinylase-like protein
MSSIENRILKNIDPQYTVQLLRDLIRIRSDFPNYGEVASFVKDEMKVYGLRIREASDGGKDWVRPHVLGTYAGSGKGPRLLLMAHTDVVPSGDRSLWRYPPFSAEVVGNTIYGRGAADTKGSLAAMMSAVKAVVNAEVRLAGDVELVAWAGDEYKPPDTKYYDGTSFLALNDIIKGDMAILGEPYDLKITYMCNGRIWIDFEVTGETAHPGTGRGINAIRESMKLVDAIYNTEFDAVFKSVSNVVSVRGGSETRFAPVPDLCNFRMSVYCPISTKEIEDRVRQTVEKAQRLNPNLKLKSMRVMERREMFSFPRESKLFSSMEKAGKHLGMELAYGPGVSLGDVPQWKDRVGLNAACLFGPGKTEEAHTVNEHVEIPDVMAAAKILALTIPYVCGC